MYPVPASQVLEAQIGSEARYRYRIYVPDGTVRGLVVYLPHYGGTIEDWETSTLPGRLAASGIASLVGLPIPEGTGYLTDADLQALHVMLKDALVRLHCPPDSLILGGFSAGGVGAMRYGEVAVAGDLPGLIRPRAIFAVDPPLDIGRWFRGMQIVIRRNWPSPHLQESIYVSEVLRETFGGSPDEVPAAYARASAVSAHLQFGGNLQYLRHTPVRLYTEPDVDFWLDHVTDLYSLNALDVVFAVNELRAMGNDQAELVVTHERGYRADLGGMRLPHAWSIVDESDLAAWIERRLAT